jgi:hypothetical protein
MNLHIKASIQVALGIAVLAGCLWIAYAVLSATATWLVGLKSELATAIVAAAATLMVTLLSLILSKYYERKGEINRENRLKKVPAYEHLMTFMFRILQQGKPGFEKLKDDDMIRTYVSLTEQMIIWGSDDVLMAFSKFRVSSLVMDEPGGLLRLLVDFEDMLLAIRKDLGYNNKGVTRGTVLHLFLNDVTVEKDGTIGVATKKV